jgi:T4 RnlA family RNA ligase
MLNLQAFIRENENWRELISEKPYCIKVTEKGNLVCFKYSQIDSDFHNPIVRECRGIILEKDSWNVVAYPFKKFFNYGEEYADEIDWKSAKVTSKEDGSLIKIYFYNGEWRVGTNSTIDAEDATLNSPYYKNFRELFDVAADNCKFDFDRLDPNYTYLMELCSCYNIIIVPYNEPKLFHIGTRNNITCEEVEVDIGIEKPKQYMLSSLEDCIAMAKTFDFTKEGFVVVDKNYHRVKVKSEDYVKTHRMISNNKVSEEKILSLICSGEEEEFLSYFPTYTTIFQDIKIKRDKLKYLFYEIKKEVFSLKEKGMKRKDFAQLVKNNDFSFLYFLMYDNSQLNFLDWENKTSYKKMVKYYELI